MSKKRRFPCLYVVGEYVEDLLYSSTQDGPDCVGRVGEGHGLCQAPEEGQTNGQALGPDVLLELLQTQGLLVHLELVLRPMFHPHGEALVQVASSMHLGRGDSVGRINGALTLCILFPVGFITRSTYRITELEDFYGATFL